MAAATASPRRIRIGTAAEVHESHKNIPWQTPQRLAHKFHRQ